jgi:hypothetical protein
MLRKTVMPCGSSTIAEGAQSCLFIGTPGSFETRKGKMSVGRPPRETKPPDLPLQFLPEGFESHGVLQQNAFLPAGRPRHRPA